MWCDDQERNPERSQSPVSESAADSAHTYTQRITSIIAYLTVEIIRGIRGQLSWCWGLIMSTEHLYQNRLPMLHMYVHCL